MAKRPAFQFYPGDWRRDTALQSVSLAARGLWIELMCLMHDAEPYGHLAVNGRQIPPDVVARLVGLTLPEYDRMLTELLNAGIPSRALDGMIYSRRMVKDEGIRKVRAESGRKGAAAAGVVGQGVTRFAGANTPANASAKVEQDPRQIVAAAAAVSSSSVETGDRGTGKGGPDPWILERFTDPQHRDAYLGHRTAAQHPAMLDGEIRALLTGMRGQVYEAGDVGQALVDLLLKGTKPSSLTLSRFAQVAKDVREHPLPTRPGSGDALSMDRVHELEARIKRREEAARAAP